MAKSDTQAAADQVAAMQQASLQALNTMGAGWVEKMSDLSAEWVRFTSERFQQDVALQHKLLHCRTPAELQAVQSEFFQAAIDRYTEEAGRMVALTQNLFGDHPSDS